MKSAEEYKVELDVFEGPLDLLLYLIKKNEVDIYDIPIERITGQYMEYMSLMRMLDLNIAGEFIVMAATLMMIKSRMLLPVEERPEDEETEEIDPRWDLVRQLVEYKKFKDVAGELQAKEYYRENVFDLSSENVAVEEESGLDMGEIGIFDLISAFKEVLARARPEEIGEIAAERYTTADKVVHILKRLEKTGSLLFTDLFGAQASRHEIVCTFLALLELIRLSQVRVRQDRHFDAIAIFAQDADGEEAS
jgi:segregation and condensation protein A